MNPYKRNGSIMPKSNIILAIIMVFVSGGCAQITETAKVIWGSSTKALEEARADAIKRTYRCSLSDCYDAVLSLERKKDIYRQDESDEVSDEDAEIEDSAPLDTGVFDIFINNRKKRHIVVLGIQGNVDTTEVGIFFSQPSLTTVGLEISSLSSNAKRTVAEAVFAKLDTRFSAVD